LRRLLGSIGIEIAAPAATDAGGGIVFLTNAVLCLKDGGMHAKIRPEWFTNCGARFLGPTIDLIAPKVVISLGEWAYRATTSAYRLPRAAFRNAVERSDALYTWLTAPCCAPQKLNATKNQQSTAALLTVNTFSPNRHLTPPLTSNS
jgi:uracil-DNA glycosylase